MLKQKLFFDKWALTALAFSSFGFLFLMKPVTWVPTLLIIIGGTLVLLNAEFRGRYCELFKHKQLKLIAWPFVAWFITALIISTVHTGSGQFFFPGNELRFVLSLTVLCFAVQIHTKKLFYYGLMLGALAAIVSGLYEISVLGGERAQGTTNNAIHFGNLTALIGVLSFTAALLDVSLDAKHRGALLMTTLLAILASVTSLTRSSVILLLCVAPLMWLPQKDRLRKWAIKAAAALLILVFCVVGYSDKVQERLRIHEFTAAFKNPEKIDYERLTSDRANMWHAAILTFKANPWAGVGPKGFSEAFEELANNGAVQKTKFHNQPHNDILYSASMGGVFKLLAYFALIFAPLLFFYKSYQSKVDLVSRIPSILGMQVVASFFLTGLTNSNFDLQIYSTMYAVLVCVLARLSVFEINAAEPSTLSSPADPNC